MGTYHEWSDQDFDWDGLNAAGDYIRNYCRRRALIGIHHKEKYGTLRVTPYFARCIHDLVYPGYVYIQYKNFNMYRIEYNLFNTHVPCIFNLVRKWQYFIYKRAYKNAVKKWPHLIEEMMVDADEHELLQGIGGFDYSKYWK